MDIGYHSVETGAVFQELIVKELGTEKLSHFLKELPSLKHLTCGSSRKILTKRFRDDIGPQGKPGKKNR